MNNKNLSHAEWTGRAGHQKSVLFTEEDFDSKGTKAQVIKIQPGGKIEPHYHKVRTEAFLVLKGTGLITLGEETAECAEHDYMLCKPGTLHAFENKGNEDFMIAIFRVNDPGDIDMLWAN